MVSLRLPLAYSAASAIAACGPEHWQRALCLFEMATWGATFRNVGAAVPSVPPWNCDSMGFNGDLMGLYCDLMGIYGIKW